MMQQLGMVVISSYALIKHQIFKLSTGQKEKEKSHKKYKYMNLKKKEAIRRKLALVTCHDSRFISKANTLTA